MKSKKDNQKETEKYIFSDVKHVSRWMYTKDALPCRSAKYAELLLDYCHSIPMIEIKEDANGKQYTVANPPPTLTYYLRNIIKTSQSTFSNWLKATHTNDEFKYPELVMAYQEFKAYQREFIITNSLMKNYDSRMAIWLLDRDINQGLTQVQSMTDPKKITIEFISNENSDSIQTTIPAETV